MNDTTSEEKYYIVETSDLSEMIGKSRFTTELSFFRCLGGSAKIIVNSEEHGLFLFPPPPSATNTDRKFGNSSGIHIFTHF